jgi:glycosyltransferase involved in cell wall biosynthesis
MTTGRVKLVLAESGVAVGGTERVVWELATRLPVKRYDVRVWLPRAAGVDEFAAALEARGIPVDRVDEIGSRWDWRGMLSTWNLLRRVRPGLLHLHHVWPSADRYLPALARSAGVEHLVITEHIVGHPNSEAQRVLKRAELAGAEAVTAVCGAVADSIARDYALPRERVRVVPNGADAPDEAAEWPAAREARETLGAGIFKPMWVCAARLEEQKGHAVLLEAAARVRARGIDFVLVFAGEGSLRDALEARTRELDLADQVRFLGRVEAIGPLLLAADACVLPSLWEGLPLSLLEAMARGRPVVASAVGGVPEAIEDKVHGRLVPPGDATMLAQVLEEFHLRPDAARQLGVRAAERVRQRYTWQKVVEEFEAVYDDVLGLASFTPAGRERRGAR